MKNALLLINLGTPASPTLLSVVRYLHEFLSDPLVIDLPAPVRYALLYSVILPFRPRASLKAYQSIWTDKGSPLLSNSLALKEKLGARLGENWQVVLGMRYGNPSLLSAIEEISACKSLTILPLYPQYSSAATGSSIKQVLQILSQQKHFSPFPSINLIRDFFQAPDYIKAQAGLIKPFISTHDYILFSYHGVPIRHLIRSGCQQVCPNVCPNCANDLYHCYKAQCQQTTELIVKQLHLSAERYGMSFQSRLGKTPWITPFTDIKLKELAKQGIKRLAITCPSFVADCLETLEEIGIRAKQDWEKLGGETLTLIPALNDNEAWVEAIIEILRSK